MSKKGFTLVELMVAITIFSLLLGGILYALGAELALWKKITNAGEKSQIENFVLSRITQDIRSAAEVLPASTPAELQLKIGTDTIRYSLSNHKVKRKKNNYSSYLTVEGDIQTLNFSYPAAKLVEIKVDSFQTQIYLRN